MRGHGRAGYARGSRAGPQHVPQDALDKKKPSFRLEGDSSPRQALRLPVIRSRDEGSVSVESEPFSFLSQPLTQLPWAAVCL